MRAEPVLADASGGGSTIRLRTDGGVVLPLDPARWHARASSFEREVLARLAGPVLDVGCGPGRVVELLARIGTPALGIDPAASAVRQTRSRGCAALQRSVFDRVPAEGRWGSVVLLDGNIGIGGDPVALLRRCRQLGRDGATVAVEADPPGAGVRRHRARIERDGATSAWFPWAQVGADALDDVARAAAMTITTWHHSDDRWVALLGRDGRGR